MSTDGKIASTAAGSVVGAGGAVGAVAAGGETGQGEFDITSGLADDCGGDVGG